MKIRSSLILFILLAIHFLSGCSTVVKSPQQVSDATQVKLDPYANTYCVHGMTLLITDFPNNIRARLEGAFGKTGQNELILLRVHYWSQTGWKFLDNASDITGNNLTVYQRDQRTNPDATVEEDIVVITPRDYLESRKTQGLDIRITGTSGYLIVKVPADYIVGFLEKYDSELKRVK